jgi:MerC mercury resistance protein.
LPPQYYYHPKPDCMSDRLRKLNLDVLGIGASLICALHCAVLPLMMTVLPLLGLEMFSNEKLEYALLSCTFLVGCISLFRGYRYHHHTAKPLLLFALGFVLLLTGHFLAPENLEALLISAGAILVIIAHVWNLRECRHCRICNKDGIAP